MPANADSEPLAIAVTNRANRRFYNCEEDLIDQGWSKHAIAKFLPVVPDLLAPSPFGEPRDPLVKYWLRSRIMHVCCTNKEYQEWRVHSDQARVNRNEKEHDEARRRRRWKSDMQILSHIESTRR